MFSQSSSIAIFHFNTGMTFMVRNERGAKMPSILHGKQFSEKERSSDEKMKAKCCICPNSQPPLSGVQRGANGTTAPGIQVGGH